MPKFPGVTIPLSDTTDQWGRKVHVNVRNDKVTLVYRWKNRKDTRKHTQRITLNDVQVAKLIASLAVASFVATDGNTPREDAVARIITSEADRLKELSDIK